MKYLITLFFVSSFFSLSSQSLTVKGRVIDEETNEIIDFVTIHQENTSIATESDLKGEFTLKIDLEQAKVLVFNRIGYKTLRFPLGQVNENRIKFINIRLEQEILDIDITIKDSKIEDLNMVREEVVELKNLPTTTGNLESVLPHIALGTTGGTGGELSSQYNVRGGNYDENLIYVNDFEIFRPQLIRSGQQEGLTFPNIDLVKDLSFSSGGFEAKYGDKMSSVLDIHYKRPESFGGSASASILGASAHLEGSTTIGKNKRKLRYLTGARYKTTQYLLGSLDVTGEYTPNFFDFQAYLTYDISKNWQLGLIGNYNTSKYSFVPISRSTALGLIDFALRLTTVFEGYEEDTFVNGMTGTSLTYIPERKKNPIFLKFLASTYTGSESETFDIIGYYRLSQIETSLGSENAGEEIFVLGNGIQHNYARNFLYNNITNVEHRGGYELQSDKNNNTHFFQWSLKFQNEQINDELNEWERIDSAGYSLPYDPTSVILNESLKSKNDIESNRLSSFVQDTYTRSWGDNGEMKLNAGVRASYWTLNDEFLFSPRGQFLYKPDNNRDLSFKLAGGLYYQTPFYREYRRLDGTLNSSNIKSQRSIHAVGGITYDFDWPRVSQKKFRLITEVYYKKLDNLISYDVDNVRIRYSGENNAQGYAMGMDIRVNGEFVPGAESWVNLSILSTRESINGITHFKREVGDSIAQIVKTVPRPSDRFFNLSMFFQDYLPSNDRFKMQLNLSVGSGLPFGIKGNNIIYRNTYRYKVYHRIDTGFSFALFNEKVRAKKPNHWLSFTKRSWLSLEVYNLMKVSNVASNTWIKTIYNSQYAISNFLTSRRINLKWKFEF